MYIFTCVKCSQQIVCGAHIQEPKLSIAFLTHHLVPDVWVNGLRTGIPQGRLLSWCAWVHQRHPILDLLHFGGIKLAFPSTATVVFPAISSVLKIRLNRVPANAVAVGLLSLMAARSVVDIPSTGTQAWSFSLSLLTTYNIVGVDVVYTLASV